MSKKQSEVVSTETVPTKKMGVGQFCKDKILTTVLTNKEILEAVKQEFPQAKTTYACIAWYRNHYLGPRKDRKVS